MQQKLAQLALTHKKALVPFITAGDPGLDCTLEIMRGLVQAGADMIELGVPFSTLWPMAW